MRVVLCAIQSNSRVFYCLFYNCGIVYHPSGRLPDRSAVHCIPHPVSTALKILKYCVVESQNATYNGAEGNAS